MRKSEMEYRNIEGWLAIHSTQQRQTAWAAISLYSLYEYDLVVVAHSSFRHWKVIQFTRGGECMGADARFINIFYCSKRLIRVWWTEADVRWCNCWARLLLIVKNSDQRFLAARNYVKTSKMPFYFSLFSANQRNIIIHYYLSGTICKHTRIALLMKPKWIEYQ